jgi:ubiquinone/menaquinone biosynthesis C-methylase UbiE
MNTNPAWFYNEIQHSGVDYSDPAQVAVYDQRHEKFRDYEKVTTAVIQRLALGPEHTVIDMGAGTGAFALHIARRCQWVYAVDVSRAMLDYARQKAERAGLKNVSFCHGGFLSYEHTCEPADAIVSAAALHHLPDFWKQVGLRRLTAMLKPGVSFICSTSFSLATSMATRHVSTPGSRTSARRPTWNLPPRSPPTSATSTAPSIG